MKLTLILFALLLTSISFSQEFTQEEIDIYISNLSNIEADQFTPINYFIKHHIVEALPNLEQYFWQQSCSNQQYFLEGLYFLGSSLTHQFALALFDSLSKPQKEKYDPIEKYNWFDCHDILKAKVDCIKILYSLGDYSKTDAVFELIDREKEEGVIPNYGISLLPFIIKYRPDLKESAKQELLQVISNASDDYAIFSYSLALSSAFDEEEIPEMVQIFKNSSNPQVKRAFMEFYFSRYEDRFDLDGLVRESLLAEPNEELRLYYSKVLLLGFATPSDYEFVKNYYQNETNDTIKSLILYEVKSFQPPPPDTLKSIDDLLSNLQNYIDSMFSYNWLGDLQFKDDLQTTLQSAKTNLLAGDSLACRVDVKTFQDSVDNVYKDSLNADPRFVTLEGWKFLYWNAQYILDRLPELPSAEVVSTYSIFATHSVWIRQNSNILSGSVGVNEAGEGPFLDSQLELSVGKTTTTPAGYTIRGNRIKVKQNATVNADVYYNELTNNGTITGTLNTPLELPLLTTLPEFHSSTPGTEEIVVPRNGEYTLLPGAYGDIQIKKNAKLIFTGGEYNINNIDGSNNDQLLFQSESEVKIKNKFYVGQLSYIGPEDTITLSADEIVFYIEGINGQNGELDALPKSAKVGAGSEVKSNFYVPNGTMWIRKNCEVEGSFMGKDVKVGEGATVKLNSAW